MSLKSIRLATGFLILAAVTGGNSDGFAGEAAEFEKQLDVILPDLASTDAGVRARAGRALETICLAAGRPGADAERKAAARALAARLGPDVPARARERLVRQLQFIGRDESVAALSALLKEDQPSALRDAARAAEAEQAVKDVIAQVQKALTDAAGKVADDASKAAGDLQKSLKK